MSFEITGVDDILKNLEAKLGERRRNTVVRKALKETGEEIKNLVKDATESYMDTGETHNTVIVSTVKKDPHYSIKVGWGQGSRWRLVHLNEFGYTRFGKYQHPRGLGKLQNVVDQTQTVVIPKMHKGLEELAK